MDNFLGVLDNKLGCITTRLFSRCMQTSTSKNVALCTIDNQGNL